MSVPVFHKGRWGNLKRWLLRPMAASWLRRFLLQIDKNRQVSLGMLIHFSNLGSPCVARKISIRQSLWIFTEIRNLKCVTWCLSLEWIWWAVNVNKYLFWYILLGLFYFFSSLFIFKNEKYLPGWGDYSVSKMLAYTWLQLPVGNGIVTQLLS